MAKLKKHDEQTKRKKILDSAIKVLRRKEYHSCPVDEIAKGAGIAKGTVYLYFKTKEELYFSVFFALLDKVNKMTEDIQKQETSATKQLRLLLDKMSNFSDTYRQLFNSLRQELGPAKGELHTELHMRFYKLTQSVSTIVEKGIMSGELKKYPSMLVSSVFISLASVVAHQKVMQAFGHSEISQDMVFEILLKGIKK